MLLSKTVIMKWNANIIKHYINKGYIYTKMGDEFEVKVEDLTYGSNVKVEVKCDNPTCNNPYLKPIIWYSYLRNLKIDGTYYCINCAMKLYGNKLGIKSRLNNSKSFEQWCIENHRQDVLDRWDYELNNCKPSDIAFKSGKKYYFKCPKRIHKSELKNIINFTNGHNGSIDCTACNSFAQWGIDNICDDFLEKYWDWDKNTVSPWEISKGTDNKKVWIKCQEKDYHGSYDVNCRNFTKGNRCPYCDNYHGKVHPLDSLGTLFPQVLDIWSNKNKKSPYEYTPSSNIDVWWKCSEGKHNDYKRSICSSNNHEFRCPNCQYSKGEKRIENYFISLNFKKDEDYVPQKEFDGLIGVGGGLLSYDFYLPDYNLLIEYQGEYHEKQQKHVTKKKFENQQIHDERKREFAKKNNINLLVIWYWDYENIEKILEKELLL